MSASNIESYRLNMIINEYGEIVSAITINLLLPDTQGLAQGWGGGRVIALIASLQLVYVLAPDTSVVGDQRPRHG